VFRPDGVTVQLVEGNRAAGRIRAGAVRGDGRYLLFGFHSGGSRVATFLMPEATSEIWEAPAPVFDIAPVETEEGTDLLLGTRDGLFRTKARGAGPEQLESFGLVTDLVDLPGGESIAVFEPEGRASWLDPEMQVLERRPAPSGWLLAVPEDDSLGLGVAPPSALAVSTGRFVEGPRGQVAVATRSGQLALFDLATGGCLFRAEWEGIADLAAGDLDGDGLDELVVAAARDLAVLSASGSPSAATDP
jgi:hypothetical protein